MSAKIVVGFDGTSSAAEAVTWASNEALLRNVPLRIVSCFDILPASAGAGSALAVGLTVDALREVAAAHAEQITETVVDNYPTLTLTTDVVPGPAAQALLTELTPSDLVVVGSSRHEGAAAFWLGSTPRTLVHDSPCPVAVVRATASRGRPDRIVVGVDGSPASDMAVRWAGAEAERHHVELILVHGWLYHYSGSIQARELTEIDADCLLNSATEAARSRFGVTVTSVLVEDSAVSSVLNTVRDGDFLVIGSRGRGGIRSSLFGSTANSILDHAAVPVVVVRSDPAAHDAKPT